MRLDPRESGLPSFEFPECFIGVVEETAGLHVVAEENIQNLFGLINVELTLIVASEEEDWVVVFLSEEVVPGGATVRQQFMQWESFNYYEFSLVQFLI